MSNQQLQDFYNADTAKKYNSMMVDEMPKVEPDLELLLQNLDASDGGGVILDVCCGTGDMLLWLASKMDEKYSLRGIDISNDMLNVARSKDANKILALEQGSMEDLSTVKDGSCAAVMCNFSIHHLLDFSKVLSESIRVLRPASGILYLSFWEGKGEMDSDGGDQPVTHYHELATVRKLLQDLGFIMINERALKEEIFPGYAMNAAYTISKKP